MNLREALIDQGMRFKGNAVYWDFTPIVNNGELLKEIVEGFLEIIDNLKIDTVVGSGYGGAQLCSAVTSARSNLRSVIVRSTPHAKQGDREIEGDISSASRAIILDDAVYSASTLKFVFEKLKNHSKKIVAVAVVYDNQEPLGTKQFEQSHCKIYSLARRDELGLTRDALDRALFPAPQHDSSSIFKQPKFSAKNLAWADYDGNKSHWLMKSSPIFYKDYLLNSTDDYCVVCYKALSGEIVWEHRFQGYLTGPDKGVCQSMTISNSGDLLIGSYDGSLMSIKIETGKINWCTKLDSYIHATPILSADQKIAVINTECFQSEVKIGGGSLQGIAVKTGKPIWRIQHNDYPPSTVVIHKNYCYATANDGSVLKVNVKTGELIWKATTQAEVKAPGIIVDDKLFLLDGSGILYSFNCETGEKIKSRQAISYGWVVSPTYYQGMIIVYDSIQPGGNYLAGYDPTTLQRKWVSKARGSVVGLEILSDQDMVAASSTSALAYYRGKHKVWEQLYDIVPSCTLASKPAISTEHNLIAFNFQFGGLQIYKI